MKKVLVFGAGVLGTYLAHVLCQAGNASLYSAQDSHAFLECAGKQMIV